MNEARKQNIIDLETARTTIRRFIKGKLLQAGSNGYVLGLSGGIDSSLAAALAVEAVGPEKVLGVLMPYKSSSGSSVTDAELLAKHLGIECRQVDISAMVDAYFSHIDDSLKIRAGNKMARKKDVTTRPNPWSVVRVRACIRASAVRVEESSGAKLFQEDCRCVSGCPVPSAVLL